MGRPYVLARWIVVLLFAVACVVTLNYNGPFFDEGIYITAGIRVLEGHGLSDRYLTWFGGSLAWPVLAGLGHRLGGIIGTRAIASLLGVVALASVGRAGTNLFGERAGFWTTLALALNGAFVALCRLGTYDILALAGIAMSFWAVTELGTQDHRRWLLVAAGAYPLAVFAKYPMGLMLVPLLGVLVFLRQRKAWTDIIILGFVSGAAALAIFLPLREQVSQFFDWRLQNSPGFGVPVSTIIFAVVYLTTPVALLAIPGWLMAKRQRVLAAILFGSMAIWPLYHLGTGDPVGTNKHLVFGFLFAYPLVGLTLSRLWGAPERSLLRRAGAILVTLALGAFGVLQVYQHNHGWPNLSYAARFLAERVEPGDQLLINESWAITMPLYAQGRISSPWDVYDTYRVMTEPTAPGPCEFDWVVDVKGSYTWTPEVAAALEACPDYRRIYSHTSLVINPGSDFRYVSYPVETSIWQYLPEAP